MPIEVYPKLGETYPDAGGVPITAAGAIVAESKYIDDAVRDGFLLSWDPLDIYQPEDRTDIAPQTASYLLVESVPPDLTGGRQLVAGPGITLTDTGPGGTLTITGAGGGGGGPAVPVAAPPDIAATGAMGTPGAYATETHTHGHGAQPLGSGTGHAVATSSVAGFMSGADRVKLDGIAPGATVAPIAPSAAPPDIAAAGSAGTPGTYATETHTHGHGAQAGGSTHAVATTTVAGFMSGADKTKVDALPASGAAPSDAEYLVSSANGTLSAERVLTAGAGITLTPTAGTLTVASTVTPPAAPGAAPPDVAAAGATGTAGTYATATHTHGHGSQAGGTTHAVATTSVAGFMSGADKTKVDGAVVGPATAVDNAITRFDGTSGKLVQSSTATLDDAGLLSTAALSVSGSIAVAGTVDGVDVGNLGAVAFVTIGASGSVANERALTAGTGITVTDGGPGGAVTIASTVSGGAPTDAEYLVSAASSGLSAERVLTAGAGITLTPTAGVLTIASTVAAPAAPGAAPPNVGTASATGTAGTYATATHTHGHGAQPLGAGTDHAAATSSVAGFMSAADKLEVNKVASKADKSFTIIPWTTTALTLTAAHADGLIDFTGAADATLTIPSDATEDLPDGFAVSLLHAGSSSAHITIDDGTVSLMSAYGADATEGLPTKGIATFIKRGANTWYTNGTFAPYEAP